jgi:DNA ligase-1
MLFSEVSSLCFYLEKENSRLEKKKIIHTFLIKNNNDIDNIKLTIDFLSFSIDNKNAIFQINDIQIIKYIALYLNIPINTVINEIKETGDIGLYFAKNEKIKDSFNSLSLLCTMNLLKEIINAKGKNSQIEKKNKLFKIFENTSNIDSCYIIRFLTGSLRIGLSEKTILEALSDILKINNIIITKDNLFNYFAVSSNLSYITELVLKNDINNLINISPKIGNIIQPQAAQIYIKDKKLLNFNNNYILQPKLDGYRLQIQYNNLEIFLFSRNGLLVNYMFPDIIDKINIYCIQNNIKNIIFDGELIGFSHQNQNYLPFEETSKRKRKHNILENKDLCDLRYVIFDILFFSDNSLLNKIYEERLSLIKNFNNTKDIVLIESKIIKEESEIESYYQENIKNKFEGIMIKDSQSKYEPGKRTKTWLKYKEVQKDSIEDFIDGIIIGYTIAKGKRKDRQEIGSLLIGIYNDKIDKFESIAQVGTGGKAILWKEIKNLIDQYISKEPFLNVIINKKHIPDFFIEPNILISIKADKITKSKDHSSGYSLRFPRIISIIKDKNKYQTHLPSLK